MATSDESKSADQGSGGRDICSEVTREAQAVASGAARSAADKGAAPEEGAGPALRAAPPSALDAVRSAIMAMSDQKQGHEAAAVSAELSMQNANAMLGRTDADIAKLLGARPE